MKKLLSLFVLMSGLAFGLHAQCIIGAKALQHPDCNISNGIIQVLPGTMAPPVLATWQDGFVGMYRDSLGSGTYTIYALDKKGCRDTVRITLRNTCPCDSINLRLTKIVADSCGRGTGCLGISTDADCIKWSTGDTSRMLANLRAGEYSVIVTTDSCELRDTFSVPAVCDTCDITVFPFSIIPDTCERNTGVATVASFGGTPPIIYQWTHGPTGPTISDVAGGNYTVITTDSVGCSDTLLVTIPQVTIDCDSCTMELWLVSKKDENCGDSTGVIAVSTRNGTPSISYQWSHGPISSVVRDLTTGDYTVIATDSVGCSDTLTISIDDLMIGCDTNHCDNDTIPPTILTQDTTVECGTHVTSLIVVTDNCCSRVAIDVQINELGTSGDDCSRIISYEVVAMDSIGNISKDTFSVTIVDTLNPIIDGDTIVYLDCRTTEPTVVTATDNCTSQPRISWNDQEINDTLTIRTYTAKDDCGNTAIFVQTIHLSNQAIQVDVQVMDNCDGTAEVLLIADDQVMFIWPDGDDNDIRTMSTGVYEVLATDTTTGCTDVLTVEVDEAFAPELTIVQPNCANEEGSIDIYAPDAVISVNTTIDTSHLSLNGLGVGDYRIRIERGNCSIDTMISISNNMPNIMRIDITDAICNERDGSLRVFLNGGHPPFSYRLDGVDQQDGNLDNIPAGLHTLVITDANGCNIDTLLEVGCIGCKLSPTIVAPGGSWLLQINYDEDIDFTATIVIYSDGREIDRFTRAVVAGKLEENILASYGEGQYWIVVLGHPRRGLAKYGLIQR